MFANKAVGNHFPTNLAILKECEVVCLEECCENSFVRELVLLVHVLQCTQELSYWKLLLAVDSYVDVLLLFLGFVAKFEIEPRASIRYHSSVVQQSTR